MRNHRAGLRAVLLVLALVLIPGGCHARGPAGDLSLAEALAADWSTLEVDVVTSMPESERGGTAIVLLHGYGSSGARHAAVGRALAGERTRVFLPTAVIPHPNQRGAMWWEFIPEDWPRPYPGDDVTGAPGAPSQQLVRARAAVLDLIARIANEYQPDSIVLVGHSQGAMLALDVAAASEIPIDRVVVVAGYVMTDSVANLKQPRDVRPVVLVSHGRQDQLVPFEHATRTRRLLEDSGYRVDFRPHDGGHGMGVAVVRDVEVFLAPAAAAP